MATGTTGDLGKVVLPNSFDFGGFYNGVERNANANYNNGRVILPNFRDGKADKTIISSRYYYPNSGDFILKDINYNIDNKRPTSTYFEGRNMNILNSINAKAKNRGITQPTVITSKPREVIGIV